MSLRNYLGFLGALLVLGGGFASMLHLPVIGDWNYWDVDIRLASIVFSLGFCGFLSTVFKKPAILRICGWAIIVMLILTFVAVYFKIHSSFSFIPMKKLASAAAGLVKYRWSGWILQLGGAVLMIVEGKKDKRPAVIEVV